MSWESILSFVLDIPKNIAPFIEWLGTPAEWLDGLAPIYALTFGGFAIIMTFHLIHLGNVIFG